MTQEINHELGGVNVYHYDAGGNLSYRSSGLYDPNHITELWKDKTYTYGDGNWKDKLTAYNGKPITYDEIGNPLTYDGWTYTWEAGRQLKKQVKGDTSIEYVYDENGLRTQKKATENGKTTVYDYVWKGEKLIGLTIDARITTEYLYFFYDEDGKAAGFVHDNTDVYFYQLDAQGNVNAIVKQDGTTAAEYTYDAWGNLLSSKGKMAKINPLTYRGYQYDHETGLYYLQSRYYNPEWGRFLNADSIIDTQTSVVGTNMFAYCDNNPVNLTDVTGKASNSELLMRLGKVLLSLQLIEQIVNVLGFSGESFFNAAIKILIKIPNVESIITKATQVMVNTNSIQTIYDLLSGTYQTLKNVKAYMREIKNYLNYVFYNGRIFKFLGEAYFGGMSLGGTAVGLPWGGIGLAAKIGGKALESMVFNGLFAGLPQLFSIADKLMNKNLSGVEKAVLIALDAIIAIVVFTLTCFNGVTFGIASILVSILSPILSLIALRTTYYLDGKRL